MSPSAWGWSWRRPSVAWRTCETGGFQPGNEQWQSDDGTIVMRWQKKHDLACARLGKSERLTDPSVVLIWCDKRIRQDCWNTVWWRSERRSEIQLLGLSKKKHKQLTNLIHLRSSSWSSYNTEITFKPTYTVTLQLIQTLHQPRASFSIPDSTILAPITSTLKLVKYSTDVSWKPTCFTNPSNSRFTFSLLSGLLHELLLELFLRINSVLFLLPFAVSGTVC